MSLKNKTIPTIIGLTLITLSSLFGGYLINSRRQEEKISAEEKPQMIKITNINDHSFTVSWLTSQPSKGALKLIDKNGQIFLDQRDSLSSPRPYLTHYVVVDQLEANHKYHFQILVNQKTYDQDDFVVQTANTISTTPPPADLAFGVVTDEQGKPLSNVLVFLSLANATPTSALTDDKGKWSLPLGTIYRQDLTDLVKYDPQKQTVEITALSSLGQSAYLKTTTGNLHPAPPLVIGRKTSLSSLSPFPSPSPSLSPDSPLKVIHPQEGEKIFTTRPEIKGQALPEKKIKIKIQSSREYEAEITVDKNGQWQYTPPEDLSPGEHTLTIEYFDQNNQKQTLIRHFIIQAAEAVSPSPTPITPLPTQPPSLSPTRLPSTPTLTPTPTTPTPTPLATPPLSSSLSATPTVKTTIAPGVQIESGNPLPFLFFFFFGLILLAAAFVKI